MGSSNYFPKNNSSPNLSLSKMVFLMATGCFLAVACMSPTTAISVFEVSLLDQQIKVCSGCKWNYKINVTELRQPSRIVEIVCENPGQECSNNPSYKCHQLVANMSVIMLPEESEEFQTFRIGCYCALPSYGPADSYPLPPQKRSYKPQELLI